MKQFCPKSLIAASIAGLCFGMPPAHAQTPAPHGAIRVALSTGASTFDPVANDLPAGSTIQRLVFDGLYRLDGHNAIQKDLATDAQFSPDGLTFTVKIVTGRTFSNGDPLDAAAVVASFNRLADPKVASVYRGLYAALGQAEAVGNDTVVFHLPAKNGHLLTLLASDPADIVDVKVAQQMGAEYGRKPVGSGPYLVENFIGGEGYKLVPNPKYQGDHPATLQSIQFVVAPEDGARMALLQTGDVQLAERVPAEALPTIDKLPNASAVILPSMFSINMEMVLTGPLKDPRVREALNLAVDRKGMIQGILGGLGMPSVGMPGPGTQDDLRATFPEIPFDPQKAQALLKAAGYRPNQLALTLTCPTGRYIKDAAICQALQGSFSAIGIKAKANIVDRPTWSAVVNTPPAARRDNMGMVGRGTAGMDYTLYRLFHSNVDSNRTGFDDPTVDKLLAQGRTTTTVAEQKPIYAEIQKRIWDAQPFLFLWYQKQAFGVAKSIKGFQARPDEVIDFDHIHL